MSQNKTRVLASANSIQRNIPSYAHYATRDSSLRSTRSASVPHQTKPYQAISVAEEIKVYDFRAFLGHTYLCLVKDLGITFPRSRSTPTPPAHPNMKKTYHHATSIHATPYVGINRCRQQRTSHNLRHRQPHATKNEPGEQSNDDSTLATENEICPPPKKYSIPENKSPHPR